MVTLGRRGCRELSLPTLSSCVLLELFIRSVYYCRNRKKRQENACFFLSYLLSCLSHRRAPSLSLPPPPVKGGRPRVRLRCPALPNPLLYKVTLASPTLPQGIWGSLWILFSGRPGGKRLASPFSGSPIQSRVRLRMVRTCL